MKQYKCTADFYPRDLHTYTYRKIEKGSVWEAVKTGKGYITLESESGSVKITARLFAIHFKEV